MSKKDIFIMGLLAGFIANMAVISLIIEFSK